MDFIKRHRGRIVFALACLAFALILAALLQQSSQPEGRRNAGISVVVYADAAGRWRSLDQGIAQACDELSLEKPTITAISSHSTAQQQIEILRRELQNGAQGFLVAAVDSAEMAEALSEIARQAPVVLVNTGAGALPAVSADDAEMGRALARSMEQVEGSVAIIKTSTRRQSVADRYEAFVAEAGALGLDIVVWDMEIMPAYPDQRIAGQLRYEQPAALVAFDNETLEHAADAVTQSESCALLYGIGCSNKVVSALDSGVIHQICFQNEYSVGYLGLMTLADEMRLDVPAFGGGVEFEIVNRDNMYDQTIERLLFPIIQ